MTDSGDLGVGGKLFIISTATDHLKVDLRVEMPLSGACTWQELAPAQHSTVSLADGNRQTLSPIGWTPATSTAATRRSWSM